MRTRERVLSPRVHIHTHIVESFVCVYVDTIRRRDQERELCESVRESLRLCGARRDEQRVGSEINVFVLRPPSYAPGKDSVSRKGLMARRMAETTELESRVEYQPVIAFVCKGPSFFYPRCRLPVFLDASLSRAHLRVLLPCVSL